RVERVKANPHTSDGRGVNLLGDQPRTKGIDRVAARTQPVERAVLFTEDRSDPNGKRYSGFVTWDTEVAAPRRNADLQRSIRADVDVPDQAFSFVLCMVPNDDPSLSASHTIAVVFAATAGTQHGGIGTLAGIAMRRRLIPKDVALSGIVSKVADNSF